MTDIRQSVNYAKYLKSQGWIIERIKNTNYFIRKLPLIGSVLKIQRPKNIDFKTTKKLEKKYRVFQTIIEPNLNLNSQKLKANNYKLSKNPYLPSKTLHLDLTSPFVFKKETRRSIKIGDKLKIVEYSTPKEIEKFYKAWKKSVSFNRYVPNLESLINLKKNFLNNHSIFLASHNKVGNIIGGAIFTRSSHDFVYYWYGFTNKEGRTSLSQYSLLYSGILWARKQGCKIFDFEGIYDDRFPNKSWLGFTHFKKSFGGSEVLYPGCYTKFRLPI
ncbi:MAG: Methicillin resistance protein [Candidatus Woesebacteria bacterium GW2011_GWA1_33_30]|uniref:Methicillin resistance protein n=1 Tax=Candidatus Woesebacteria bacterium GW2011_GWA2_33_28 TaxID=1618561 RepID=A0A0F9ZTP4_9BACT|nr:MAG: Methicillin resistance protein [Candidatus Woesebacteria bacterium GW2011_GWA2_33_28]KKP48497.1 MAG: Methicillin resistance protein [Candidatus Woesebacteria bacterium GW2011_GWA1_33_30]KKP49635.1 MAG: Methicillin resistance protein [Microgenomates group bacterium GW2011_GWC1_33_32]KKP52252.1 MAG: Methicillin resistance protein [Candidatus Woesebacteria bacterium GW2011_GWB1_33_38]KKP58087.1 MAG: Methicillin resistance protein [Microgenomates group bacterium GW2011_GWD1_33_9]